MRVELAEAGLEGDDVVAGYVLPRVFVLPAGVHRRIPDPDHGAARGRVLAELADDRGELVEVDPLGEHRGAVPADPRAVAAAPRLAVVRELDRAGQVVRQPLDVVAPGEDPHRLGDLGGEGGLAEAEARVAVPRLGEGDLLVEALQYALALPGAELVAVQHVLGEVGEGVVDGEVGTGGAVVLHGVQLQWLG